MMLCMGLSRAFRSPCTTSEVQPSFVGVGRNNCRRSHKASYHSTKNFCRFQLLHQWNTRERSQACIQPHEDQHWLDCDKAVFSQLWWIVSAERCSCTHVKSYEEHWTVYSTGRLAPNSPHLSPIENVWDIMATAVYADPEPQTLKALECRLCKVWRSIFVTTLNSSNSC